MNEKQKQVWDEVQQQLGEHFSGFLLAIVDNDVDDDGRQFTHMTFDGGWMTALGLAEYAKLSLASDFYKV